MINGILRSQPKTKGLAMIMYVYVHYVEYVAQVGIVEGSIVVIVVLVVVLVCSNCRSRMQAAYSL